jgi:hypothetical protein
VEVKDLRLLMTFTSLALFMLFFFWTGKGCPTPPLLEPASLLFLQKHLLKKINYAISWIMKKNILEKFKKKKQKVFNNLYMYSTVQYR